MNCFMRVRMRKAEPCAESAGELGSRVELLELVTESSRLRQLEIRM